MPSGVYIHIFRLPCSYFVYGQDCGLSKILYIISAWALRCSFFNIGQLLEPLYVERATGQFPRLFCICQYLSELEKEY